MPNRMSIDSILDSVNALELEREKCSVMVSMQKHGTLTEQTKFSYPDLVESYQDAISHIKNYDRYMAEKPGFKKTLQKKREIIASHLPIVDFHAAWAVLNLDAGPDKTLSKDEFKNLDVQSRQKLFLEALEQKKDQWIGLYRTRNEVIQMCIERKILPQ